MAEYDALVSMLRGEAGFESAWEEGRAMSTGQAVELALKVGDAL